MILEYKSFSNHILSLVRFTSFHVLFCYILIIILTQVRPCKWLKLFYFSSNLFPSRIPNDHHIATWYDTIHNDSNYHYVQFEIVCAISFWLSFPALVFTFLTIAFSRTCFPTTFNYHCFFHLLIVDNYQKMFLFQSLLRDMELVFHVSNLYVFADCMHFHFYLLKGPF